MPKKILSSLLLFLVISSSSWAKTTQLTLSDCEPARSHEDPAYRKPTVLEVQNCDQKQPEFLCVMRGRCQVGGSQKEYRTLVCAASKDSNGGYICPENLDQCSSDPSVKKDSQGFALQKISKFSTKTGSFEKQNYEWDSKTHRPYSIEASCSVCYGRAKLAGSKTSPEASEYIACKSQAGGCAAAAECKADPTVSFNEKRIRLGSVEPSAQKKGPSSQIGE